MWWNPRPTLAILCRVCLFMYLRFSLSHAQGHRKFSFIPKLGINSMNIAVKINKAAFGKVVWKRNWKQSHQAVVATWT